MMINFQNAFYRDHHLCEEPDCEEKKFVVFRYLRMSVRETCFLKVLPCVDQLIQRSLSASLTMTFLQDRN